MTPTPTITPTPTPTVFRNCSLGSQTILHGQSITAFAAATVPFGSSCQSQLRTCNDGTLTGTYSNLSCNVGPAASCSLNGQTVAHGSSVTAFLSSSVAFGSTCQSQTRICSNGTLSGSYGFSTCAPVAARNCSINGQNVNHGSSITTYSAASVPFGSSCQSQLRTCNDGTLSGSYGFASCSQSPAPIDPNCGTWVFNVESNSMNASVTFSSTDLNTRCDTSIHNIRRYKHGNGSNDAVQYSCEAGGYACSANYNATNPIASNPQAGTWRILLDNDPHQNAQHFYASCGVSGINQPSVGEACSISPNNPHIAQPSYSVNSYYFCHVAANRLRKWACLP